MERFLDGTDQENSKKQERKNAILVCSPSVGNALGLLRSCDPSSGEPTRTGTSLTTFGPFTEIWCNFLRPFFFLSLSLVFFLPPNFMMLHQL
jgi:hypothetical protein